MFDHVLDSLRSFAEVFHRAGKHIYLVGGAVRNLLLGKEVQDYDFTTDALPDEVMNLFKRVIPTGIQHGTVSVSFQKNLYEVTTFRVDGDYTDGRRPDSVRFTPSLEEDLKRRDFTINALAIDLFTGELFDFHGGRADLERKILRAIGNPVDRFTEDALRILRLFRFAAQLNFRIDESTLLGIRPVVENVESLSQERIRVELQKIQASEFPHVGWISLQERGLVDRIVRSVECRSVSNPEWEILSGVPVSKRWGLTLALWNPQVSSKEWERQLKSMTFSNQETKEILVDFESLVEVSRNEPTLVAAKRWVDRRQSKRTTDIRAAIEALDQVRPIPSCRNWIELIGEIETNDPPVFVKELAIGGTDLVALGYKADAGLGATIRKLQEYVWSHPGENVRGALADLARSWLVGKNG